MRRLLIISVIVLGISSVMAQLTVIREFLAVFGGNELTVGIILGNWTLLTGIGSYLGKKIPPRYKILIASQLCIAVLPVVILFLVRMTKNALFIQGEIASLTEIFIWSFILLAPLCLLTGGFLILVCNLYSTQRKASDIGKVYLIDSAGDITGGALFSFVLIYFFNQFQIVYIILFMNLVLALLVSLLKRSNLLYVCAILLCGFSAMLFLYSIDDITTQQLYRGQPVIYQKSSLYGHIVVTEVGGQITVFENNVPFFSTQDIISNEETVHYAMVQSDEKWMDVLLIGGGASGTVQQVLKYPAAVDYVELDPHILKVANMYTDNLRGANVYEMDGRQYVKETDHNYHIIILDVPDPDSAQLNRFYTVEFFREVEKILHPDGIFSLSLSTSPNYLGTPTQRLNSSIYKSLKSVFAHVIIVPGNKNYFVASDRELTYDIAAKIEEKGIPTEYVNKYYLSGTLTEDRISMVLDSVKEDVKVNSDFNPEAYYYYLLYWMSQFRSDFTGFLLVLALLIVVLLGKIVPHLIPFALTTTGFAGTALEVVLVLGFQILYGYVYSQIGGLITAFLLGLMIGAFYITRTLQKHSLKTLILLEFLVAAFSIGLAIFLPYLLKGLFFLLAAFLGVLVGAEFPLASKVYYSDVHVTAAVLYSADLLGGCLGALLVSTLLVPLLGVVLVCVVVGALNVASGLVLLLSKST